MAFNRVVTKQKDPYLEDSSGLWAAASTPLVDIVSAVLGKAPSLRMGVRHC